MNRVTKPCLLIGVLGVLFFSPGAGNPVDKTTFKHLYAEGRQIFYTTLKERADDFLLIDKDREILQGGEAKISGLYEHLMNFYYFVKRADEVDDSHFGEFYLNLSRDMAEDLITSIPVVISRNDISPLKMILMSTGYYSRKVYPSFRRFLRGMGTKSKGNWALKELRMKDVHSLSKGKGIKIAIIDSGLDPTIREIKARIHGYKNLLDAKLPLFGRGIFPFDWGGHGTSVATVIYEVAPESKVMVIKFLDTETMGALPVTRWTGYLVSAGMFWAAKNGADVINLSLALHHDLGSVEEAARYCWNNNVVVVSAMGNDFDDSDQETMNYPADYPWTIAVGGVSKDDSGLSVWKYSAQGAYIDVVAPAGDYWVEWPSYLKPRIVNRNVIGNSFATPVVAGTVAMMLAAMDEAVLKEMKRTPGRVVEAVRELLRKTASNELFGSPTPNHRSGYGLIDALRSVQLAKNFRLSE